MTCLLYTSLGYQWGNEYYASDYFQQLWDFAIRLIQEGKA